ncbi:MFS transporter [Fundidesulfovibrio putealis]|uniref:MFS transporter n=1 Tax=Fundidesulfovibrio putealis TaxID=270496 RepID=UPI00041A72AD|nr:MFS transporter [Fundidesulfovibrio putealis]
MSLLKSDIFANTAFTRFWLSRSASGFAYHMSAVAIGWQVYELTGSVFNLGLVGLVEFLPQFLLTLVAGHVADRVDRKTIASVCQLLQGLMALTLAVGSVTGALGLYGIFGCVFMIGTARAFETPSLQALLPGLVEPAQFPRMLAWSASVWRTAVILGPAAGGLLYMAGPGAVYAASGLACLLAAFLAAGIPKPAVTQRKEPASWRSVMGGIEYIRKRPDILGAISMDLFSVLLGGATALLPVFAKDILATGPWGLGILRAAPSVGALCMSLFLVRRPLKRGVGRKMYGAVAVFGLATIVFGLSENFALSCAALAVLGASDMVSVVVRSTLVQLDTPDELRGRVSAVNSVFIGTSNQLGDFESGVAAALLGSVGAVVLGGVGTLVVVALWVKFFPGLFNRDELLGKVS